MLARGVAPLLAWACTQESAAPRTPPPAAAAPRPSVPARPRDDQWGRLRIVSRAMELEVPELSTWSYHAGKSWVRLEHAPSDSVFELWLARAERLVRPADCEARARLERPDLWKPQPETTVERRTLDSPKGFRTELAVGIAAEPGDPIMRGYLVAFGASPGRCLAVHFATRVQGDDAEVELARRLDMIASRSFPSLTLRAVEDRVDGPPAR